MIPHKTSRGEAALKRLKVFDGCPPPYDTQKKMVVPAALRHLRLQSNRKYCYVGDVAKASGWKYGDVVDRLEDKRRARSYAWHLKNAADKKSLAQAEEAAEKDAAPYSALLSKHGY